jgi:hypothetical protein
MKGGLGFFAFSKNIGFEKRILKILKNFLEKFFLKRVFNLKN